MEIKVSPNRMVLLQLKKQLSMAIRGHKLLKDKQDELMRKFISFIQNYRSRREAIDEMLAEGYRKFLGARAIMSRIELFNATEALPNQIEIKTDEIRIMNTRVPVIELVSMKSHKNYSTITTSASLDASLKDFSEILPVIIKLAELEKRIEILAIELERTRRRVNALEYVLIPTLEDTIHEISMKLGENERATLTRLMKIKDIVRRH
ncbi:MAG: V-type ATP synthase subunit D [Candidatus Coatesbacteria bacterium]|nr:V-type ATP synthase subunit D [Candidatus Coatesbacteria bacterium]